MKLHAILASLLCSAAVVVAAEVQKIAPADAAKLVADGKAVLVDVREPAEWAATGVAAPAVLLAKSDFDGAQKEWKPFLDKNAGKEIILYCRSGHRAGIARKTLAAMNYTNVENLGGMQAAAETLKKAVVK